MELRHKNRQNYAFLSQSHRLKKLKYDFFIEVDNIIYQYLNKDTMGAAIAAYFANTLQHIDAEKLKGVRTTTKEGEDEGDEEEEEGEGN
ncbi:MAG: hypothetical protein EZS28_003145 [Streblomastix strix]|uniref:Uncharacterized protein n=1 Tax=Streblomastix strix TaxID=222440 RepID=A0A5J4X1W2_9EUKA|nr:MAG: hypothetical protein EZS28_003145 [Streblomastix strix]